MVIDFQMEAAKRREDPRKLAGNPSESKSSVHRETWPHAANRPWPTVECGSGWYHAEAMDKAGPIQSHRDWD